MSSKYSWLTLSDLRGGRNAADDPLSLADTQVQEARNGDWFRCTLFRKRGGATKPSIGSVFTGVISSLLAHMPSNNPAAAELWGVDNAATPNVGRMAAATTFSSVTLTDAIAASNGHKVRAVSFNGKFFFAYDSAVDRLHVYDPNLSSPKVRRVGLDTPAAPTGADGGGAGSYPATVRYYRVRMRIKSGSIIVAQSEPGAVLTATPSGSNLHYTVTKPATVEEATHWMLEASDDNVTFYELVETAVGTSTYNDTTTVSDYADGTVSAVSGTYTKPTSGKYLLAAFNRILMAGSHESGGRQSRIWFTAALGSADRGDDERIPNTTSTRNFFDIGEATGGDITGFAPQLVYDAAWVFKYSQIRKVLATGSPSPVFSTYTISETRGAIEQECICVGEDAQGKPAIYFLDRLVGPMVVGATPPIEIGQGVRDSWDSVNLAATTKVGQVVYYRAKGQVWFWWATGSNNTANILAIYTIATGAWSVDDTGGKIRQAVCAVMFSKTLGASMSRDLVPYVGYSEANNTLLKCDTTDTSDDSEAFQGLIKTKPLALNNGKPFRITTPWVLAKASSGVTLTMTLDLDFGVESRTGTVTLTAAASETRVFKRVEGLDGAGGTHVAISIGDASATANGWQIERIYIPWVPEDAPIP